MAAAPGANGALALSVNGRPAFSRCDAYIQDLLLKGQVTDGELKASVLLAEEYVTALQAKKRDLQNVFNVLNHRLRPKSAGGVVGGVTTAHPPSLEMQEEAVANISRDEKDIGGELILALNDSKTDPLQTFLAQSSEFHLNAPLGTDLPSPLTVAAISSDNPAACKLLIKAGADANYVDPGGCSALHWAVVADHPAVVKTLVFSGAKHDLQDAKGLTSLHYACLLGATKILNSLIKHGPGLSSSHHPCTGATPLIMAALGGHHEVVKMLVKQSPRDQSVQGKGRETTPLHAAVWGGSVKCVKALATHCTWREGVALRDCMGRTPLIIAALKGDVVLCQLLLKKGAGLGEADTEGRSVLHWAALSGQVSCVEYLLSVKGGVALCCAEDSDGATPLHYAALNKDTAVLTALLREMGSKSGEDGYGIRSVALGAMVWAVASSNLASLRFLLEHKDIWKEASGGWGEGRGDGKRYMWPQHAAACVGSLSMLTELLAAGFQVNEVCSAGCTPLHYASKHGHTACVKLLLSQGALVDTLSENKESSLHLAVLNGHSDTAQELLEGGASRDLPLWQAVGQGDWCIHMASHLGHTDVLKVIISAGGSVNEPRPGDGHTPLYLAASGGHLECCRLLMEHQAQAGTRMKSSIEGLTALDIALLHGHSGCASYLMSCHAPSGGGVYHRAAATIQAVWRYYRHKRRRAVTLLWAAVLIQRCVRRWLSRVRATRERHAHWTSLHRAAGTIQRQWRKFISEKRRYEATYSRLMRKLRQEQMAASLIVAELQAQTQHITLPTTIAAATPSYRTTVAVTTAGVARDRTRATPFPPLKPHPKHLLRVSSGLRPGLRVSVRPVETKTVQSAPSGDPSTVANKTKGVKFDESSGNGGKIHLPPLPSPVPPPPGPEEYTDAPSSLQHEETTPSLSNGLPKLPPISKATAITTSSPSQPLSRAAGKSISSGTGRKVSKMRKKSSLAVSGKDGLTAKEDSVQKQEHQDGVLASGVTTVSVVSSPHVRVPHKPRPHRFSTFRATPLGYKPYYILPTTHMPSTLPEDTTSVLLQPRASTPEEEDASQFRLHSATEDNIWLHSSVVDEAATKVTFSDLDISAISANSTRDLAESRDSRPVTLHQVLDESYSKLEDESSNKLEDPKLSSTEELEIMNIDHTTSAYEETVLPSQTQQDTLFESEDKDQLVNQVERFERLMKVLTLLKGSCTMEELIGEGGGGVGMEVREQIRMALDEAIQLRKETTALQSRIKVSPVFTVQ